MIDYDLAMTNHTETTVADLKVGDRVLNAFDMPIAVTRIEWTDDTRESKWTGKPVRLVEVTLMGSLFHVWNEDRKIRVAR